MPTILYLVRHGECHNPQKVLKGRLPGFPLTKKGVVQSTRAARMIKDRVVAVYTSPLTRTMQTARIIARNKNAPVFVSPKLNEWRQKQWEGVPLSVLEKMRDWKESRNWPTMVKEGERFHTVAKRMLGFYSGICKKYKGNAVVAVSNADPMMALVLALQKKPLERLHREKHYPAHGSVVKITKIKNKIKIRWLRV